jgi:ATP-dependent protease HslVU (ClpYQ) peptidase subunit
MTVIAAIRVPNKGVLVGCDSMISMGDERLQTKRPKWIILFKGQLLIAGAGHERILQAIEHMGVFEPHPAGMTSEKFLMIHVLESIRVAISRAGMKLGAEEFLFAYRGEIWRTDAALALVCSARPYAAVGAGAAWAEGTIRALLRRKEPPRKILLEAMETAAEHCESVAGPFPTRWVHWPL